MNHLDLKKAAFLDRDGVLNLDKGYVYRIQDFEWIEGSFEALLKLRNLDYELVIVTNQAGIGRGYYSEKDFHDLCDWMKVGFLEHNLKVSIYYCPHHPTAGVGKYLVSCKCRKPEPGMLLQASVDLGIDLSKSILFGDKLSDIEAGIGAGLKATYLINSKNSLLEVVRNL